MQTRFGCCWICFMSSPPRPDNLWASSDEPWSQPLPSPGLFVSAGEEVSAAESFGLTPALGNALLGEAPLSAPPKATGASRAWATARKVISQSGGERRRSFLQQVVTQIQQPRKTGVVGRAVGASGAFHSPMNAACLARSASFDSTAASS